MSQKTFVAVLSLAFVSLSHAQLVPDRTYYGINREIPMTVKVPDGKKGEVTIQLLEAGTAKQVASAAAAAGAVNLATLFPQLWSDTNYRVLYAQLAVGEEKIGSAVVLQPMLVPLKASVVAGSSSIRWREVPPLCSGYRAYSDKHAVLETSLGKIEFAFRPEAAPNTVWNFRQLVEGGFYTGVIFHRIIPGFVVQGGDPTGAGNGGPGFHIDLERTTLPHDFGVLSMARSGEPDSAGSQFFICLSRAQTAGLDRGYTAFAQAVSGHDTIKSLASVKLQGERPIDPPVITNAKLIDAPPYGTGPKPIDADGNPIAPPASPSGTPATPASQPPAQPKTDSR